MYQIAFIMTDKYSPSVTYWTNPQKFSTKEMAMLFAQNVAKGFNGCHYNIYYRIINA